MKTKAAVLAGKNNVYIREFDLPEITEDELLVKIISNSVCLSTYKAAIRGNEHKRVPNDVAEHPAITGHEFAGIIEQVGKNLEDRFKVGEKFVLQPAMGLDSGYSAGYSYEYFGGNATYCI
ncbi:MAG: alcohol dehydrogenase catalytic domain-containing protein, partial [Peptacetobacter hiranonis]|nr:alcohol dehydrogenase catalytic domain-containing protein [Peptacetobacter hiranonis]